MVVFQGQDNPLSNFFPCDLRVFGEHHKTAEHAYQLTKAIRSGNTDAAQKVRDAESALDAKRIGNSVKDPQGWSDDKETVMEEIVTAKADQIADVRAVLENSMVTSHLPGEPLICSWGTGLDKEATLYSKK